MVSSSILIFAVATMISLVPCLAEPPSNLYLPPSGFSTMSHFTASSPSPFGLSAPSVFPSPSPYSTISPSYSTPSKTYGTPTPTPIYRAPTPVYSAPKHSRTYLPPVSTYGPPKTVYESPKRYHEEEYHSDPAHYEYQYTVQDPHLGTDFGHKESRQGDVTHGSYMVLLPDGRRQIVEYVADKHGYRPTIRYEGTPRYESTPIKQGY